MAPGQPRCISEGQTSGASAVDRQERKRSGMGIFATLARRGAHADGARDDEAWAESVGHGVPVRFEAVAERLVAGRDATDACAEVGRELARDGAALGEALD